MQPMRSEQVWKYDKPALLLMHALGYYAVFSEFTGAHWPLIRTTTARWRGIKGMNCLREIKVYGVGQTFGSRALNPDGTLPPLQPNNPPWLTSRNFVDFDRFTITWIETAPGIFKVKDMEVAVAVALDVPRSDSCGCP